MFSMFSTQGGPSSPSTPRGCLGNNGIFLSFAFCLMAPRSPCGEQSSQVCSCSDSSVLTETGVFQTALQQGRGGCAIHVETLMLRSIPNKHRSGQQQRGHRSAVAKLILHRWKNTAANLKAVNMCQNLFKMFNTKRTCCFFFSSEIYQGKYVNSEINQYQILKYVNILNL